MSGTRGGASHDEVGIPLFFVGTFVGTVATVMLLIELKISPDDLKGLRMSYAELSAVMLGAVAVLVTVLGVFIAILAIWGYAEFKRTAKSSASEQVKEELANGTLRESIDKLVLAHVSDELADGRLRKMLEERVDRLIYSGAQERAQEEMSADRAEPGFEG